MNRGNARPQVTKLTKYIVMFIMLSVGTITFSAHSTYAEEGDSAPSIEVPTACSSPMPEVTAPGIHFVPTAPTNNIGLQWNWTFTPPEAAEGEKSFAAKHYGYSIYNGTTLQTQGTLTTLDTTLGYAAPGDGTYSLYLWTIEDGDKTSYCSIASIALDTTAPVIVNNGYTLDDSTAMPQLTTEEVDLTYSWSVNDLGDGVGISDPATLNPLFTFSLDGMYNFILTATDIFGNVTYVPLSIVYLAPFVPPEIGPEIIPIESIPEPIQTYTPLEESEPISYNTPPIPSGDGKLPPVVDASIYASTATGREALSPIEKEVAGAVTASQDGWKFWGISWYWWVLIAAIIASAWLWIVRTYRTRFAPDDI